MTDLWPQPDVEPDLQERMAEVLRADTAALLRLYEARRKHDERRQGKSDHPIYPVDECR